MKSLADVKGLRLRAALGFCQSIGSCRRLCLWVGLFFIGLTFLYLGFGGLLILCLAVRNVLPGKVTRFAAKIGTGCAYVGTHSYSIYLRNTAFLLYVPLFLRKFMHIQPLGKAPFSHRLNRSLSILDDASLVDWDLSQDICFGNFIACPLERENAIPKRIE